MELFHSPGDLQTKFSQNYWGQKSLGFVPTMGALHPGHGSLVQKSKVENELTVVSIFVNPTQFGPKEDLSRYPRTPEADLALLESLGVDAVFMPQPEAMYPFGKDEVLLHLSGMDQVLCGASRPGHFNGVVQVVNKLFNLVRPTRAYFGLKDFQQWSILRRMGQEFFHATEVVGCPTVREADGLAMSSRNRYLSESQRPQALYLSRALQLMREQARPGASATALRDAVLAQLGEWAEIKLDYFEIRHEADLSLADDLQRENNPRGFIAAWCGSTRLIDNMSVFG